MRGWRYIPNFPLYKISRRGEVVNTLDGRILQTSKNNKGEHYHLESESGRVVAMKPEVLISWAYNKETE